MLGRTRFGHHHFQACPAACPEHDDIRAAGPRHPTYDDSVLPEQPIGHPAPGPRLRLGLYLADPNA